jgi:hypothetical protein
MTHIAMQSDIAVIYWVNKSFLVMGDACHGGVAYVMHLLGRL